MDEILPFRSLKDLAALDYDQINSLAAVSNIPLLSRPDSSGRMHDPIGRLLVCHDMKGGYLRDRFAQGTFSNPGDYVTEDCLDYTFQHWHLCDIFIYFAHHRVSIPPPSWTNAAHRNGVKCLGTIITEWNEGIEENICLIYGHQTAEGDDDFRVPEKWSPEFANLLVELACRLNFDGWFVNIESPLKSASIDKQVKHFTEFIRYFTERMHEKRPGSLILWYDSLTIEGKIDWQDCLNEKNRAFFDSSDGLFTNYTWKAGQAAISATNAGHRKSQIYTGIDAFGRNTFGGGGFNCWKALEVIRDAKTSAAIFAPGWSLEAFGNRMFHDNDMNLWYGLRANGDGRRMNGISSFIAEHCRPSESHFYSNFDRGYGKLVAVEGKVVFNGYWYHVGTQSVTPSYGDAENFIGYAIDGQNLRRKPLECGDSEFFWNITNQWAFNGGSSLELISKTFQSLADQLIFMAKLFTVNVCLCKANILRYSGFKLQEQHSCGLYLIIENTEYADKLLQTETTFEKFALEESKFIALFPFVSSGDNLCEEIHLWEKFGASIAKGTRVKEIGVFVYPKHQDNLHSQTIARLGEVAILSKQIYITPQIKNLKIKQEHKFGGSFVSWDLDDCNVDHCNIYLACKWIGYAFGNSYWIPKEIFDSRQTLPEIQVVPVDVCGREWKQSSAALSLYS